MIFAKRNLKEIIREPLSLIFNFILPILLLLLFFCFIFGKTEEQIITNTPMFSPMKIVPSTIIFSFSFLTLFVGMLVSKDKSSSFILRIKSSPIKAWESFIDYVIPMLIIAILQMLVVYIAGYLLSFAVAADSLRFKFTLDTLLSFFVCIPLSLFFISIGILLGSIVSDKIVGGVSSIVVNFAAITSGIFMPLAVMGGFKIVCQALPFYHFATLAQDSSAGVWINSVHYFDPLIEFYKANNMSVIYNVFDTSYVHIIYSYTITIMIIAISIFIYKKRIYSNK